MLNGLKKRLNDVSKLDENKSMQKIFSDAVLQSQVLDMNVQNQLYEKGVDALGRSLGEYSPATIYGTKNFAGKIEKGQRYDHVTLKDTGEFYKSFRFVNERDGFKLTADTIKDGNDLENTFGKVVGLTAESRGNLVEEVRPAVVEVVRKTFAGKGV